MQFQPPNPLKAWTLIDAGWLNKNVFLTLTSNIEGWINLQKHRCFSGPRKDSQVIEVPFEKGQPMLCKLATHFVSRMSIMSLLTVVSGCISNYTHLDLTFSKVYWGYVYIYIYTPRKSKDQTLPIGRIGNPECMDHPKDHSLFGLGPPGYMYIYIEPNWPLFLKVNPPKQGRTSNQNKGQLGSRYTYIYLSIYHLHLTGPLVCTLAVVFCDLGLSKKNLQIHRRLWRGWSQASASGGSVSKWIFL